MAPPRHVKVDIHGIEDIRSRQSVNKSLMKKFCISLTNYLGEILMACYSQATISV